MVGPTQRDPMPRLWQLAWAVAALVAVCAGEGLGLRAGAPGEAVTQDVAVKAETPEAAAGECFATGACVMCEPSEKFEPHCQATGRREPVSCPAVASGAAMPSASADTEFSQTMGETGMAGMARRTESYRPCSRTEQDDLNAVFRFWVAMMVVGSVACCLIQRQQKRGLSLYDVRIRGR